MLRGQAVCQKCCGQSGFYLPFCALLLMVFVSLSAYVLDFGRALDEQRGSQFAVDSAALAAANLLSPTASDSEILTEAQALAATNGLPAEDIYSIECGTWNQVSKAFGACGDNCCGDNGVNAVRVTAAKTVKTAFAQLMDVDELKPFVQSVALARRVFVGDCIRPFALDWPTYGETEAGDIFIVGKGAPGNWGKVQIGDGQQSGSPWFEEAMLTGTCNVVLSEGDSVEVATGDGGVSNTFEEMLARGLNEIVIPIMTEDFPNGGSDTMTIQEFVRLRFISQSGNGGNWVGTFEMLERDVDPLKGGDGFQTTIVLVK